MLRRSEWWSLNPARDAAAKFLAFVREHYLFVDAVPQAYIDASFGRAPRAGQRATPDGVQIDAMRQSPMSAPQPPI
jgi:hypothetical protein